MVFIVLKFKEFYIGTHLMNKESEGSIKSLRISEQSIEQQMNFAEQEEKIK